MEQVIIQGDCLEEMKNLESDSIDLILTDPPYGTIKGLGGDIEKYKHLSNSTWDVILDNKKMFEECSRVLKKAGKLILFSQEPYTSKLITEVNMNMKFNYRLVWIKDHFANCLVVNKAPVSYFEDVLVFSKNNPKFDFEAKNPIRQYALKIKKYVNYSRIRLRKEFGNYSFQHFLESNEESTQFSLCTEEVYNKLIELYGFNKEEWFIEYHRLREINEKFNKTLEFEESTFNLWDGKKIKSNVLQYKKDYGGLHPTQKPIELLKDLIKTYSNEGDTVLDFTAGSFSTLVACQQTNRKGIGIELEEKYVNIGRDRLKQKVLSNLSPPVQTSNSTSLTSDKPKGFNMGDKVSATPTPKDASHPSHHPNIKRNLKRGLTQ